VPAGLLYYSQLDSILRVEARPNEIRALIMARNELAAWMSKRRSLDLPPLPSSREREAADVEDLTYLPPTIDNARECKMCYANDSCMLYRKVCPHLSQDVANG
jgi:DNA replication ATP-dependent helicase Dna2